MIALAPQTGDGPLFAFAGGGTGGHLYPAIALAHAILDRVPSARFVFFGTRRRIDWQILGYISADLVAQDLAPLSAKPWRWPAVYSGFRRSSLVCRDRFDTDRPAIVISSGGLSSVPAVREAHRVGIPIVMLNPDAVPGRANRRFGAYAAAIFAQWDETVRHYPASAPVVVTGCPVRREFLSATRNEGIRSFGLSPDRRTLLVTGASLGARSINEAVVDNLDFLEASGDWQILHFTGENEHEAVRAAYAGRRIAAQVVAYAENMAEALAAADLVVSRAGASTLAELTAIGRPSVLMPYPHHRDQHQTVNAKCLETVGAARIVRDALDRNANALALRRALQELFTDDAARTTMSAAARRLGRPDAASDIASQVLRIAGVSERAKRRESVETVSTCTR